MNTISSIVWTSTIFGIGEGGLWFVPYGQNILCRYDLNREQIAETINVDVDCFHPEGIESVYCFEGVVFLLPGFENKLYVYDINKDHMACASIPPIAVKGEKFLLAHRFDDTVFLFPRYYDRILKYSISTNEIASVGEINNMANGFYDMDIYENNVYLVNRTGSIYEFDCVTGRMHEIHRANDDEAYCTVSYSNGSLLLSTNNGRIYSYDLSSRALKMIAKCDIEFTGSVWINGGLCLNPLKEKDYFIYIDIRNRKKDLIYLREKSKYESWPHATFSKPIVFENSVYCFNTQYRTLISYNPKKEELKEFVIQIDSLDETTLKKLLVNEANKREFFREGELVSSSLTNFLEVVSYKNSK